MRYLTVSGIAAVLLYLGFVARCGGTAASSFAARHRALGRAEAVATSTTRLSIDDASGVICSLVHTGSGRDFAAWAGSGTGTLYAVEFAAPAGTITSADAARVNVTRGADGTAVAVFRHDKPFPVTVTCRFRPERNTRYLLGRISLRAEQSCRIAAVTFPVLRLSLPLSGTGADDAVVLPGCDGIIVQDPLRNAIARDLAYPGGASMQFLGAYDKSSGVYLASRDAEGYIKELKAHRKGAQLELAIRHGVAQAPTTEWALPYDVALTTFAVDANAGSGWEAAADLYRPWAVRQKWCEHTLADRFRSGDLPRWLGEPSLFYAFSLAGRLPNGSGGDRSALVPNIADSWRKALGGPVTFMLMTWEKRGPWVAPDYFPPMGDGPRFSAVTRALHDKGHRAMVYVSGLNWTLHKTARYGHPAIDDQAEFDRSGKSSAASDGRGEPVITGQPSDDVGQFARICPATPLADQMLRGSCVRCQDYGIDAVQADQLVGGSCMLCSHPAHAHPISGGNWCARALYADFERARVAGKARTRDFVFSMEEPGEFFIPVLDIYHARDYIQFRWPRTGDGTLGVPLFTHVYHDYCLGYGGDSTAVTSTPNDSALYAQAMNIVCGKAPAVSTWTDLIEPATVDVTQRRLLRSHFALWRSAARDYLVFGKRIASPALNVPNMPVTFSDRTTGRTKTLAAPSVLAATYELPGGRRGEILACIAHEPIAFSIAGQSLRLEPGEAVFRQFGPRRSDGSGAAGERRDSSEGGASQVVAGDGSHTIGKP